MNADKLLELLNSFWLLILAISGGIGGWIKWRNTRRKSSSEIKLDTVKNDIESSEILFKELEKLKIKIIAQTRKELENSTVLAEKEKIINLLKKNCLGCYQEVMKILNYEISKDSKSNKGD